MADLGVDATLKVKTVGYHNPPQRKAGVMVADVDEGEGWADGGSLMLTVSSVGGELIQDDTIEEIDFDDFVEEGNEN